VTLGHGEAAQALPVVRADLPDAARLRLLEHVAPTPAEDRARVLAGIVEDGEQRWRSPWLQACALYEASSTGTYPTPKVDTTSADAVLRETVEWAAGPEHRV
jgi:hypothetical protein